MLIPAMTVSIWGGEEKNGMVSPLLTAGVVGLAAVLVINGSLTQRRSIGLVNPLYEYSKSVTLLGTVKGLEAVVACAFTVGWYVLLSLLIGSAEKTICGVIPNRTGITVWGSGFIAAVAVLLGVANPAVEASVTGVIWVGIPMIVGLRKKLKKQKNNA